MTGMEAWSIVSPIIASHMNHWHGNLDALDEAYVMVFGALNEHDKREREADNAGA